ncbi:MAG: hypothetical protein KF708_07930 [Pirellulales bacterium]|nr:hypothetical protein [Pirellulales bacterium]
MDDTKSFAEDLVSLRDDIASDVGGILQVVRERKESKTRPAAPPKPANDAPPVASANQGLARS